MLFRVYSRYVPNLTRQDGSAMERLLASQMSQGVLLEQKGEEGGVSLHSPGIYVPALEIKPQPIPKPRGVHGLTTHQAANSAAQDAEQRPRQASGAALSGAAQGAPPG
jgi:integrase